MLLNPNTPLAFLPPPQAHLYEITGYVYLASLGVRLFSALVVAV